MEWCAKCGKEVDFTLSLLARRHDKTAPVCLKCFSRIGKDGIREAKPLKARKVKT